MDSLERKENLKKYRIVSADDLREAEDKMNALAEISYKAHSFTTPFGSDGRYFYEILMSLSSDSKYDNIEALRDVEPSQVDALLKEGWIVAESWAKNVRMVRKIAEP
jgi:hypothetical protein